MQKADISDIEARYRADLPPDTKQALVKEATGRFLASRKNRAFSVARLQAQLALGEARFCPTHGAVIHGDERECEGVKLRRWQVEIGASRSAGPGGKWAAPCRRQAEIGAPPGN